MSLINLDEVAAAWLSLSPSPNLLLNDPFPLFSQPIFYPLDHRSIWRPLYADERRMKGRVAMANNPDPPARRCRANAADNRGMKHNVCSWAYCFSASTAVRFKFRSWAENSNRRRADFTLHH